MQPVFLRLPAFSMSGYGDDRKTGVGVEVV
jgi:hypothetical protein